MARIVPSRSGPPAWFKPLVFAGALMLAVAIAAFAFVTYEHRDQPLTIGRRTFIFPAEHIVSVQRETPLFIRIKPPDRNFELVYDQRLDDRRDRLGVPQIFSINDEAGADTYYVRDRRTLVACRRGSVPRTGCGTWLRYGEVRWSILFPESRLRDADRIAAQAQGVLRDYDPRARRLMP